MRKLALIRIGELINETIMTRLIEKGVAGILILLPNKITNLLAE